VDIPLIARARDHAQQPAIVDGDQVFTYAQLLQASCQIAVYLLNATDDLLEQRVAFLIPPSFQYVAVQWGIWRAGGIAVPLCTVHPRPELEYVIDNAKVTIAIAHPSFELTLRSIAESRQLRFLLTSELMSFDCSSDRLPAIEISRRALMLYTSGTTSKPKGVVSTHQTIQAQVTSLISAWEWTAEDWILNVLPLHHIHGVINVLTCALWAGARCEFHIPFNAQTVWERIMAGNITLLMAVPTIYVKLIAAWESALLAQKTAMTAACSRLRLMVSGSAALPIHVLEQWQAISGQQLLERYGMTEIGMALSNPLQGLRQPGHVGMPLPGVEVRLVDEAGKLLSSGTPGEIQVRGPNVFLEYWDKPEATIAAFCDGWFRTGDTAVVENGSYRILGRSSVDIIKTGGYKVSALEIEEVLRSHPEIQDCAVVGVVDPTWGERVCAALVLEPERCLTLAILRRWAKEQLATYKVPAQILTVAELPRNAMGKVTKPAVIQLFLDHNAEGE
jgi:malonyl-CoA/methylmalonyl-CoA synthetase